MREIGRVVLEALIVAVVGLGLALIANARSDEGLKLGRDYFKLPEKKTVQPAPEGPIAHPGPTTQQAVAPASAERAAVEFDEAAQQVAQVIRDAGLTPVGYEEVSRLYADPKYNFDAYVFIDARNERHYREGHIPRAWRLDHVHPEPVIEMMKPFIEGAEKIVVYCNGGYCDDSLLTAGYLLEKQHVNPAVISVYVGGFQEWVKKGQPVEKGERMSGEIVEGGAK